MILTFLIIGTAIVLYATERFSIEIIALGQVVALMLLFLIFPQEFQGKTLEVSDFLQGFANPALITVIALLIVGQGLFQTDALEKPSQFILDVTRHRKWLAASPLLILVGAMSAFLNNTPVVVMVLPILTAIATAHATSPARILMPLSFITILGGMTTMIGSSTNLLVANVANQTGEVQIEFFTFTQLGAMLAAVGSIYVLFILPRILTPRKTMAEEFQGQSGKQFIAQIPIIFGHPLVGSKAVAGLFPELKDMTVRLVQRGERPLLPPFENVVLSPGDTVIVAATRSTLTRALSDRQPLLKPTSADEDTPERETSSIPTGTLALAEAVVAPGSRLIGRTISQAGFRAETGCVVTGLQRRSRMPRMPMSDIRMESGDVLLIGGNRENINRLRGNRDVLLLDWSTVEVPQRRYARRALGIFAAMITLAVTGMVPIVVAAVAATFGMIAGRCLNVRQALRTIDSRIFMLIGSSIASSLALEATGGASLISAYLVTLADGYSPAVLLSLLFAVVAVLTNLLSNNATAVLFTPIAIDMAHRSGTPVEPFIVCLIMAANCSFATPIGYQTNLIVMGPGHYRFSDFIIAGTPLAVIIWLTFSLIAPWYYSL
ncbi:SLC13 family permease [Pseudovibrio exalbescens]|uniref:SLC13 family permease n=1 Tax=Pseudovibrio exalbescens TaxID=197461 RepID=UPI0023660714|nr:SLC13 family permease [Pseudovibrio exalbescens]MDD7908374.1 SLC13 family permease [Pseudovibrio exalbescens]